jgi:hypothetical protein
LCVLGHGAKRQMWKGSLTSPQEFFQIDEVYDNILYQMHIVKAALLLFRLIDSTSKIIGWLVAIVIGHIIAWSYFPAERSSVPQRCGAALIVLGVVVAARGFLREGVRAAVDRQLPRAPGLFTVSHETVEKFRDQSEARRSEIETDVRAERIWAFWLIIVGTIASGYGDLPLKWFCHAP